MRFARRVGAIDQPDGTRHLHERPTPRLGGLALYAASFLAAVFFLPLDGVSAAWLAGGGLLSALGVSDDLFHLSPIVKLTATIAVSALPAAFGLSPAFLSLGGWRLSLPHPLDNLFSLLWVLLLSNAYNLIDGADGLAATLGGTAAASLFLTTGHGGALLLSGCAFGFLPYNRPSLSLPSKKRLPTRTFLGDTGALFLGYSLAVFSLSATAFSLFSVLFFALPLYDLFRVFILRLFRGRNPFHADRTHLHHRLLARGYDKSSLWILCFLLTLFFCAVGMVANEVFALQT
jgi:UDP-GlcNAc:undecaprenyl-phosphate GlcNAc-1-phosphate transferase